MKEHFFALADRVVSSLTGEEGFIATLAGEDTDFVRFNRGRVRQAGGVSQAALGIRFFRGRRSVDGTVWISGAREEDDARVRTLVTDLRATLDAVPDDPYFLVCTDGGVFESPMAGEVLNPHEAVSAIADAAGERDLVGIWSSGKMFRGLASSYGKRAWRETASFVFDWSVYLTGDKAAKSSFAGTTWNEAALVERFARMDHELAVLARPARVVKPGEYRAYLSPTALNEIFDVLSWTGFGKKSQETKQSPLLRLVDGSASFSDRLAVRENMAGGIAPRWNAGGFEKPDATELIRAGKHVSSLVSPRSAKEYDVPTNGADDGETPTSLDVDAGELALADAAKTVGDGVYVNNLWYLNFSDRAQGRITGMTRFATFLVEKGELVCPLAVMRFDDSVFRLFGEGLVGFTREREFLPSTSTYGQRSTASAHLPGAVVDALRFTL